MRSRGGALSLRITAQHLLENLASDLYADHGASLWEIIRNGVCACFPGSEWVPGTGRVEISLERTHPLSPDTVSLLVVDRGRGFTADDMDRFVHIGPSLADSKKNPSGQYGGAAQKRIGRFAALALNELCYEQGDPSTGFFVLTRTASERNVTLIPLIPAHVERDQGMQIRTLSEDAPELGLLRNQRGSFTAVLIQNSVFSSLAEIRDAVAYRIPRKHDQMFELLIGKEKMYPPALASRVNVISESGIEIHVDVSQSGEGIWFTDAATGLRVASGAQFHLALPFPFGMRELTGDVFIPGLLAHQDTSRAGLSARYLKSQEWKNHCLYLSSQAERLKALLGEEERLRGTPVQKSVADFVRQLHSAFGVPDIKGDVDTTFNYKKDREKKERDTEKDSEGGSDRKEKSRYSSSSRRIGKAVRIGTRDYVLISRHLGPLLFAQAEEGVLYVNAGTYKPLPTRQEARDEHIINAILFAAAAEQNQGATFFDVQQQVGEWRMAIFGGLS